MSRTTEGLERNAFIGNPLLHSGQFMLFTCSQMDTYSGHVLLFILHLRPHTCSTDEHNKTQWLWTVAVSGYALNKNVVKDAEIYVTYLHETSLHVCAHVQLVHRHWTVCAHTNFCRHHKYHIGHTGMERMNWPLLLQSGNCNKLTFC